MKLSSRDKKALGIGGAVLFFFCLFQFIIFPLMDNRTKLVKAIGVKNKQLVEMQEMVKEYQKLGNENSSLLKVLEQRTPGFSLFSFIEQNAAQSQVKENINYMRPSEIDGNGTFKQSQVEMKLNGISITQLVSFLEKIESPENLVGIIRLSVQKNTKQDGMLDAILQIVSVDELLDQNQ